MGEICEILDAKRKPITKKDRKPGPYPYYGATCIQDYVAGYIFDEPLVLLGEDGAKWGKGDKSAFCVEGKIWVNNHAHVLRPLKVIDNIFLSHALTILDLQPYITGTTVPKLNQERMCQIHIPLPPLTEQKRIVARIEELFKIADSLKAAAEGLEEAAKRLDKKILDLAIRGKLVPQDPNDEPASELLKRIAATSHKSPCKNHETPIDPPFVIPKGWVWCRLGEVFQHNTGKALNRSEVTGIMREYITTSNVYWDGFKLESLKQMPFTDEELKKCMVRKGDLLICEGGDIGRAAIWNIEREVCIQNHLHRLRPYNTEICVSYFVLVLRLYKYTGFIQGRGIGLQGLSSNALHNLPIPLPPLAEQKRIVSKIEELRKVTQALTM